MAWQRANDETIPWRDVDGTVLQASTTNTSTTQSTAVELGKGSFIVEFKVTAVHQESGFDSVILWVESNTKADTTTYVQIGAMPIGDATGIGVAQTTGTFGVPVDNYNDNGVRINCAMQGSTDSITYSAKAYPRRGMNIA